MTRKKKIIIGSIIGGALLLIGGLWIVESATQSITTKGSFIGSLAKSVTGGDILKGHDEGRTNIVLLGMRGKGIAGGGELTDTIMVVSIIGDGKEKPYKLSIVSVPRDLLVTTPDGSQKKINATYISGEQKGTGKGLEDIKKVLNDVTGQTIHYVAIINFSGFEEVIDTLGGVELTLDKEFSEPLQFNEVHVCDGANGGVFTIPTGDYEIKYKKDGRIRSKYPLCGNKQPECGGVFTVPVGTTTFSGKTALCYARSRVTSSDFDRARRQHEVLEQVRTKAMSLGFLANPTKIQEMMGVLGDNAQIDTEPWELQKLYDLYKEIGDTAIEHKVLENTEEGLLYAPAESSSFGYILLPRGDNYNRVHELFSSLAK